MIITEFVGRCSLRSDETRPITLSVTFAKKGFMPPIGSCTFVGCWGERTSARARDHRRLPPRSRHRDRHGGRGPGIGAVASFSPCLSMLRGELPKREHLRILLAHGSHDERCPVEESRSLARPRSRRRAQARAVHRVRRRPRGAAGGRARARGVRKRALRASGGGVLPYLLAGR